MTTDARGIAISYSDRSALDAFELALRQYQSYVGDALATIDGAIAAHPDFVMGHLFRAGLLMTFAEARYAAMARESQVAAEALVQRANSRERALMVATRKLVDGDWESACDAFDRVLIEHPRDAFAIQTAHLFDFLRGDAKNLRDRITRVLPAWSESVPGFSYILGMHAFGLEECNQYSDARATAERALMLEPRDGWAVHAAVHCHEMLGQIEQGIAVLDSRRADWSVDNGFAFHNWWHLALFHLDRGETDKVLELFDTEIYPEPSADGSYILVDATALLWRLHLAGADVRARAERVAAVWASKVDEQGFYAFNDVHALLAFVMAGRTADFLGIMRALETPGSWPTNQIMARDVGFPLARGIVAFADGQYARALPLLEDVRDRAQRFGGSHAQRDLITLTIIEAALRAKQASVARHYLAERLVLRAPTGIGRRLQARIVGLGAIV